MCGKTVAAVAAQPLQVSRSCSGVPLQIWNNDGYYDKLPPEVRYVLGDTAPMFMHIDGPGLKCGSLMNDAAMGCAGSDMACMCVADVQIDASVLSRSGASVHVAGRLVTRAYSGGPPARHASSCRCGHAA